MTGSAIASLWPIIKVLYKKDGSIRSFLTQKEDKYLMYRAEGRYPKSHLILQEDLEEIKELLKSPMEKIDRDELEKF